MPDYVSTIAPHTTFRSAWPQPPDSAIQTRAQTEATEQILLVHRKWNGNKQTVEEMTQAEKDAVNASLLEEANQSHRDAAEGSPDEFSTLGTQVRALVAAYTTRDNRQTTLIREILAVLEAMRVSSGNIRLAIPPVHAQFDGVAPAQMSNIETKERDEALDDYQALVRAGGGDKSASVGAARTKGGRS